MNTPLLFEEIQGSSKKGTRDFCKAMAIIFAISLLVNLILQKGAISKMTIGLFTGIVVFIGLLVLLNVKMVTQIKMDGIYVRYAPFQPSFSYYSWESISEVYIREYNALLEYGGWGIRIGFRGKAYIASGNTGLQIIFKDDSKVLIGTRQPDAIANVLRKMGRL